MSNLMIIKALVYVFAALLFVIAGVIAASGGETLFLAGTYAGVLIAGAGLFKTIKGAE